MDEDLKPLAEEEIKEKLKSFSGWMYHNNKISKEFKFSSFNEAVEFINKLTPFCNKIDHHPDIHIFYKKIVFDLTRFSVGGKVTERDFKVASEIERLFNN
jgi:4a-hydroxytetrahydrobiopterin dehydratase